MSCLLWAKSKQIGIVPTALTDAALREERALDHYLFLEAAIGEKCSECRQTSLAPDAGLKSMAATGHWSRNAKPAQFGLSTKLRSTFVQLPS